MMILSKQPRTSPKPVESSSGISFVQMAGVPYNTNSIFGNGTIPSQPAIVVRAEEALIVILVLALWVAAIALFFNRWGKIRMLEPYQPKFIQQHRPSCPLVVDQVQHRSFSKFNLNGETCAGHPRVLRPRQNSVFVGSSMVTLPLNAPRKVKSAFDLQNLVLSDPALNKSGIKVSLGGESFRRASLFPVHPKRGEGENLPHGGERRLSFKDLVDIEKVQRCERVQCYLEKEPVDVELLRKNKKIGDTKQRSSTSNHSSLCDSRHNSITNQDTKVTVSGCGKFIWREDRRSSLLPVPSAKDFDLSEQRPEVKGGTNSFRRNSVLLVNMSENEKNFLVPRENVRSGVHDFRRNSMLIINNLTEDIGCRSVGRNFSLGGSNVALTGDFPATPRRNSVIPPFGCEAKQKLIVPHVSLPKPKAPFAKSPVETKYVSSHKPSRSLDCGDSGKHLGWKKKKEGSQPSLVSEAKQQFLLPTVPLRFAGSSASLHIDFGRRDNRRIEESKSAGNLASDFVHPKIIETSCCSPGPEDESSEGFDHHEYPPPPVADEFSGVCHREDFDSKPAISLTTSLTNLNISSASPLNVVTSGDPAKTNATCLTHV